VDDQQSMDRYLAGANFPATKQQLVSRAYSNGAGGDALAAFHALPEREYVSARDVGFALRRTG
jgi:hypothetical protein